MKLYSKILGILSGIIVLSLLGLIVYLLLFESNNSTEKIIALSLLIPIYILFHFLIIHRFGFSLNNQYTKQQRTVILAITIISFSFLFTISLKAYLEANRLSREEKLFEEMKDWGTDSTAFHYYGHLKTKYVDKKIFYQLSVRSKIPFTSSLTGFIIHLLDKDGFLIDEISITDYSNLVDEDKTFGIQSNSNKYIDLKDYSRIGKWNLLVTTKN
jgi:hypothetical protein